MPGPRRPGGGGGGNEGATFGGGGGMFGDFGRQEPPRSAQMGGAAPPSRHASPETAPKADVPPATTKPLDRVLTPVAQESPLPMPTTAAAGWPAAQRERGWPPPGAIPINPGFRGQDYSLPHDPGLPLMYPGPYSGEDTMRPGLGSRVNYLRPEAGPVRPLEDGVGRVEEGGSRPASRRNNF